MKKKRLLEMPVLELTDKMYQHALNVKLEKVYPWSETLSYEICSYFRAAQEDGILQINVYFTEQIQRNSKVPAYRLFFDNKEKDFITYDVKNRKWITARVDHLKWPNGSWDQYFYLDYKEQNCIEEYLGIDSFKRLSYCQGELREKQWMESYKRTAAKWDALMKGIPPLPKDWNKWLAKQVIAEHYIFYEYRKGGKTTGLCSRCGKEQVLLRPKYNKKGICRNCGHPVIYKSIGKCGSMWTKNYTAHLLQRMGASVVSRQFQVSASYLKGKFEQPRIHFWEERRVIFFQSGNVKAFYYGEYKDRKMHWIETEPNAHIPPYCRDPKYYAKKGMVYRRTLPDLAKKELKQTGILEMVRFGEAISPEQYLLTVQKTPVIEKAAKAGLLQLAADLVKSSWGIQLSDGTKLHQCLVIGKDQLKRLRTRQGGYDYLNWLQFEKAFGKKCEDDVIAWFIKAKVTPQDIRFIMECMSPRQVMNYMINQQKRMPNESISGVLRIWKDYMGMAERCGVNIRDSIIFRANNLKMRHDEMVRLLEAQEEEEKVQEILEQYPNLNEIMATLNEKYSYQNGDYAVVAPKDVLDLIHEGNALHHCVNKTDNYFERISNGETYILFLRKAEALSCPYYTLEVEPGGTIRQKRTEFNRQNADIEDASAFLKEWQEEIQKRLTKEDQKLAKRSKKLREQEYGKLREERVQIAHGTYNGQLLIDLLEADLMEIPDAA